jgi:enamine deaminase RidA (YjgF/YER057c/UK114 family)
MKKQIKYFLFILSASVLLFNSANAQSVITSPEARIKELGIKLRTPGPASANFLGAVRVGNLVYLSGQGPLKEDGTFMIGKVGKEFSFEEAKYAARLTGISLLEALKAEVGNLSNVKRIVKVLGMVQCTPEFKDQPKVINAFSDLMVAVFGEKGKHARSAVGMSALPANWATEIEMVVEVED